MLHPRYMTDLAAAKHILALWKGAHRPRLPLTNRWQLHHIVNLRPDSTREPSDNESVEWLIK